MTGYYLISKKNLKCIGSKGNKPEQNQWHNARTFDIPCRLWHIWKKIMQSNKNSKMFKIIKSKGNLVAIGEYNGKKIFMTEERITKGANKMKHTPTPWETDETFIHPKGKKITIAEVYNRSNYMPANGYEIPNELEGKSNAEFIVHAVNMHELLLTTLKQAVESLDGFGCEDVVYYRDIIEKAERK